MDQLITKINEINRAEKYIAEAIILEKGTDFQESIPTYNIRVFNGNPDARAIDIQSSNILYQVPVQVSREGEKIEDLKQGDKVLVGYFNNDMNSPYIMFNQTASNKNTVINRPPANGGRDKDDIDTTCIINGSGTIKNLIEYAKSFIIWDENGKRVGSKLVYTMSTSGEPNRYGINNIDLSEYSSKQIGADCSSYVEHVFAKFGVAVGSNTSMQHNKGQIVGDGDCSDKAILDKIQLGDIIIVSIGTSFSGSGAHVGIKVGNDEVIHMSSSAGCTISSISEYFFSGKRWDKYAVRRHIEEEKVDSFESPLDLNVEVFVPEKPYDFSGDFKNK